jgi:UDP-glucose 4-epimerase
MNILLTGHCGMIGSQLIKRLSKNHDVIGLDRIEGNDLLDHPLEFEGIDLVIHLAAESGIIKSLDSPLSYWKNNVLASKRLFEAFPNTRILYASSSTAKEPDLNPYAASKFIVENIAPKNSLGMRFTTSYGSNQRPTMFISKLVSKTLLYVNDNCRDFIHIDDICDAIETLMNSDTTGVIDVGTGISYHLKELVRHINYCTPISIKERTKFERYDNRADTETLFNLGWNPKNDVKEWLTNNYK